MHTQSLIVASVAAAMLCADPAFAQEPDPVQAPAEEPAGPPADLTQPSCTCHARERPCLYSHLALGFELGGGAFEEVQPFGFGEGTGSGTSPGPSWGVRIGWEFTRWRI